MTESRLTRMMLAGFCLAALAGSVAYLLASDARPQALVCINGAALVLGFGSVMGLLARDFPAQNLAATCAIIGVLAWIETWIRGSATPRASEALTLLLLTMVWSSVLLTARFMARLILGGCRGNGAYGIRVWVLATLLATHLNVGIAAPADAADRVTGQGQPGGLQVLRWAMTALVMLVCTAPWLVPKRPVPPLESQDPMVVWLGANLLCGSAAIHAHDWVRASVILAGAAVASAVAMVSFTRRRGHTAG